MRSLIVPVFAAGGAALVLGCRPDRPEAPQAGATSLAGSQGPGWEQDRHDDPVVAEVGGYEVRLSEVRRQLEELPVFVRMRYQSPESRREFLESWVEFLALTWAARDEGLDRDPQVVDALKSEVASRYLRDRVDATVSTRDAPEEWIRSYYEQHRHEFVRPEQREVRQVVVRDPDQARRVAFRARKRAAAAGADPVEEFTRLVRAHSQDPRSREADGVVGRFPWVDPGAPPVPPSVVEVAAGMQSLFEVRGPVPSPEGYHILFVSRMYQPIDQGFEEARPFIVERWMERERERLRRERIEAILARARVEVDGSVVDAVRSGATGRRPEGEKNP